MRMCRINVLSVCAVVAMALLAPVATPPAEAAITDGIMMAGRDPEQVARACIRRVRALTEGGIERNVAIVRACVPRIRELVEQGREEEAVALAHACVRHIRANTRHTGEHIVHVCHHCIRVLRRMEAPELARAVRAACERALQALGASQEAAVQAIRDALP